MSSPLAVFATTQVDHHSTPHGHPERAERLRAVLDGIRAAGLEEAVEWYEPGAVELDALERVHDRAYVERIREFCAAGGGSLDPDTFASAGSWDTSLRAAGAVVEAIDALREGEHDLAFVAARPPGHHAVSDRAMGFCLFNNVAVGARHLTRHGARVAIVDWDVHHGNGTQDIFYDDPNVLYVSMHQQLLYPGTGRLAEVGASGAERTNLNLPFPAGTRGDVYRRAVDEVAAPLIEEFAPDWLLISAGFDAHRADPLASIELTSADFADLGVRLRGLVPPRRTVLVLEGGYDLGALTASTGATLAALLGEPYRPEHASSGEIGLPTIVAARQRLDFP